MTTLLMINKSFRNIESSNAVPLLRRRFHDYVVLTFEIYYKRGIGTLWDQVQMSKLGEQRRIKCYDRKKYLHE